MAGVFVVVGCGRIGSQLAYRLHAKGKEVVIVDRDDGAFGKLHCDFRGKLVEGDVLSEEVLQRSGIAQAQGVAAVTSIDSVNAVVGHLARSVYAVPHVVVRNFDPRWREMIEAFGLQLVSASSWGAQRLEELLAPEPIHSVFSAGNGEVDIYEILVPATCAGRHVADLAIDGQCVVAALSRAGRATIPSPDSMLETGDIVHVSATADGFRAALAHLGIR